MDFRRDSSRPGKLRLNLRGRDEETSEECVRERVRFVAASVDMRLTGRESADRIAAVVLSMEVRAVRYCRSGDESEVEVERNPAERAKASMWDGGRALVGSFRVERTDVQSVTASARSEAALCSECPRRMVLRVLACTARTISCA